MIKLIPLLYIAICIMCPFMYSWEMSFVFWGNKFDWDWFCRDSTYTMGLILSPCIAFIEEKTIRNKVAILFIIEGALQLLSLLKDNNSYDSMTTVFQCLFLFVATLYIYDKYKLDKG